MVRTNAERSATTRAAFLAAAHQLFAESGFHGTSTEQVLIATGFTRGALYHHFRDKADLFAAVCEQLHQSLVHEIEIQTSAATQTGATSLQVLKTGCAAWLRQIAQPDVHRILILEAPAALGMERWQQLDQHYGYASLLNGVQAAQHDGFLSDALSATRLAQFLNGAMNQVVLTSEPTDIEFIIQDVLVLLDLLN